MNHSYTPGSLFLTPRAPTGKRLPVRAQHHMRASEDDPDEPKLPEMEQNGHVQGKIGGKGDLHGDHEFSAEGQWNSNRNFQEPGWHSDYLGEGRKKVDPEEAARQRERDKLKNQRAAEAAKAAQAAQAAKAAQQPKPPSRWKFTAPPASAQRVPGL